EEIEDIFRPESASSYSHIETDYLVYKSLEGVPVSNGSGDFDFLEGAYSSSEMIVEALEGREDFASLGERIPYLMEEAENIVANSGNARNETLLRYTLNRTNDFVKNVLPIAGRNSEYVAQWLANFMVKSFT